MQDSQDTIAVIGTGVIGTGWILRFLANGIRVKAFDKNSQQLHFLKEEIMSSIKKFFFGSKINFHSLHNWKYAKVANKCSGCQIDPKYPVAIAGDFCVWDLLRLQKRGLVATASDAAAKNEAETTLARLLSEESFGSPLRCDRRSLGSDRTTGPRRPRD